MCEIIGNNVALIPIRGGSKSIPLKNIKCINGRPLVYWVLDAVNMCAEIDKIVVSTDSQDIRNIVSQYNSDKLTIVSRTQEVSTDSASTESVMLEFAQKFEFNNLLLVQATSPLLTSTDLEKGFREFENPNIDSVLSVVRQKRFIWEDDVDGYKPVNYDYNERPRRQEFDGFLVENGAFYITTRKMLLDSKCRLSGRIGAVEMDDKTYFEIDEISDWEIVEKLLGQREDSYNNFDEKLRRIKCVISDNDGVLTDGGMYYSENGDELKKFNTKDGMAFKLLKEAGFITGIITGEDINLVKRRANKMKLDFVYLGIKNKIEIIEKICTEFNLQKNEIAYIGDDINDLEVIEQVGFGCSVADGMKSVKSIADYVTTAKGGRGTVREVAEIILNFSKE